jgi:hypothetical protein
MRVFVSTGGSVSAVLDRRASMAATWSAGLRA